MDDVSVWLEGIRLELAEPEDVILDRTGVVIGGSASMLRFEWFVAFACGSISEKRRWSVSV